MMIYPTCKPFRFIHVYICGYIFLPFQFCIPFPLGPAVPPTPSQRTSGTPSSPSSSASTPGEGGFNSEGLQF